MKLLQTYSSVFALAFLLLISGCKKLTTFNLEYSTSFTVPSTIGTNVPVSLPTPDVKTNSESAFSSNDTKKKWVESIILDDLRLTITDPSNKTFSFLKSIELYINADGLDEVLIASRSNIPDSIGSELVLTPTGEDLEAYIKKDEFSLRTEVVTDETIFQDIDIRTDMVFVVTADTPIF